jgi:uncharacterized membrane protein
MNEQQFGKEIAKLLNQSSEETIRQSTLYRLQLARQAALEHYRPSMKIMSSGRTSVYGKHGAYLYTGKLLLLLTVLFILMHIALSQFLDNDKYAAIDAMILADDLPIDAYIDNEFEEWLDID